MQKKNPNTARFSSWIPRLHTHPRWLKRALSRAHELREGIARNALVMRNAIVALGNKRNHY